jgi:hypothetical protein
VQEQQERQSASTASVACQLCSGQGFVVHDVTRHIARSWESQHVSAVQLDATASLCPMTVAGRCAGGAFSSARDSSSSSGG